MLFELEREERVLFELEREGEDANGKVDRSPVFIYVLEPDRFTYSVSVHLLPL